jgi:hypothetical protein
VDSVEAEREEIRRLVRELGEARGSRLPTPEEVSRLRNFFGRRVLRSHVDDYIRRKYFQHVGDDAQWPEDTTEEEYLESLREIVLDPQSAIYMTDDDDEGEWTIYFVGRARRSWLGPRGSGRIVVLFNGERHILVTGFQPEAGDAYVSAQGGFWLWQH